MNPHRRRFQAVYLLLAAIVAGSAFALGVFVKPPAQPRIVIKSACTRNLVGCLSETIAAQAGEVPHITCHKIAGTRKVFCDVRLGALYAATCYDVVAELSRLGQALIGSVNQRDAC